MTRGPLQLLSSGRSGVREEGSAPASRVAVAHAAALPLTCGVQAGHHRRTRRLRIRRRHTHALLVRAVVRVPPRAIALRPAPVCERCRRVRVRGERGHQRDRRPRSCSRRPRGGYVHAHSMLARVHRCSARRLAAAMPSAHPSAVCMRASHGRMCVCARLRDAVSLLQTTTSNSSSRESDSSRARPRLASPPLRPLRAAARHARPAARGRRRRRHAAGSRRKLRKVPHHEGRGGRRGNDATSIRRHCLDRHRLCAALAPPLLPWLALLPRVISAALRSCSHVLVLRRMQTC